MQPLATAPGVVTILVVGDSWAVGGGEALSRLLREKKGAAVRVRTVAVPSAQTAQWLSAEWRALLAEEVRVAARGRAADEPRSLYVWVSSGLHDLASALQGCTLTANLEGCLARFAPRYEGQLGEVFRVIVSAAPSAAIVGFGYDILPLAWTGDADDAGVQCEAHGMPLPKCGLPSPSLAHSPAVAQAECFNRHFSRLQTAWEQLGAKWIHVEALDMRGTLHAAAAGDGARGGERMLERFGAAELFEAGDCYRPSPRGFEAIVERMWTEYWAKKLDPDAT